MLARATAWREEKHDQGQRSGQQFVGISQVTCLAADRFACPPPMAMRASRRATKYSPGREHFALRIDHESLRALTVPRRGALRSKNLSSARTRPSARSVAAGEVFPVQGTIPTPATRRRDERPLPVRCVRQLTARSRFAGRIALSADPRPRAARRQGDCIGSESTRASAVISHS